MANQRKSKQTPIGKRIKRAFGQVNDVNYVTFSETDKHIVVLIVSYDGKITNKQVNAVLNQYPIGFWRFVESRIEKSVKPSVMMSVYTTDRQPALQSLQLAEATKV